MPNPLQTFDSVVVLMLENRSFDNLIGFLYADDKNRSPNGDRYDGLTGDETNPDSKGKPVQVKRELKISNVPNPDPGEEFQHINMQLFSTQDPPPGAVPSNQGFVLDYASVVKASSTPKADISQIMRGYDPSMIPCLAEIIRRYAVCDRWFASVPSQTWPNRSFVHAAQSNGHVNNAPDNPLLWHIPTIFNRMAKQGTSWSVYYDEAFVSLTWLQMSQLWPLGYWKHFHPFDQFLHDANAGALPAYSFIEPNFFHNPLTGEAATDQHPIHDVVAGDSFIGKVFNAVVTSPQWLANKVLFIITYDEHGGCFDHVKPASNATPPKKGKGDSGFDFKRFGVRVPAIVVSPYVKKGSVFHAPDGKLDYDHTSILATVERRFGINALTARDKAALDLGGILTLVNPRKDSAPLSIPQPKGAMFSPAQKAAVANLPLNDLQQTMVKAMQVAQTAQGKAVPAAALAKAAPPLPVKTVGDAYKFIQAARRNLGR
jgi:phospholipase C